MPRRKLRPRPCQPRRVKASVAFPPRALEMLAVAAAYQVRVREEPLLAWATPVPVEQERGRQRLCRYLIEEMEYATPHWDLAAGTARSLAEYLRGLQLDDEHALIVAGRGYLGRGYLDGRTTADDGPDEDYAYMVSATAFEGGTSGVWALVRTASANRLTMKPKGCRIVTIGTEDLWGPLAWNDMPTQASREGQ